MSEENRIVCAELIDNGGDGRSEIYFVDMAKLKSSSDIHCQKLFLIFDQILKNGWKGYPGLRSGVILGGDWFNKTDKKPFVRPPCLVTDHIHVFYE